MIYYLRMIVEFNSAQEQKLLCFYHKATALLPIGTSVLLSPEIYDPDPKKEGYLAKSKINEHLFNAKEGTFLHLIQGPTFKLEQLEEIINKLVQAGWVKEL